MTESSRKGRNGLQEQRDKALKVQDAKEVDGLFRGCFGIFPFGQELKLCPNPVLTGLRNL